MTAKWQYKAAYEAALVTVRDLKAENAKLRNLVSVIPRCWDKDCEGCPMAAGTTAHGGVTCTAESRMREVGIEVER